MPPAAEPERPAPRFLDAGEAALVVEFGSTVDPAINDRVLALDTALRNDPPRGLTESVPTYRSLMIHYDPLVLARGQLVGFVEETLAQDGAARAPGRTWILPCCYDPEFAEDIAEVAGIAGLAAERMAELHRTAEYRVYMYGFAPGFAYLGGLPAELAVSRRASPRAPHPQGALLIGGGLAAVGTFPMPTGWYVVARTPERLFFETRDPNFLIEGGDNLRFEAIDAATFVDLDRRAASGEVIARATG
ncbi:5-oxoprolinase subunit B family protein [Methylobacterium planeticum]|uniref:Allophanate hydrolase subunit 1 n=1 Tax=Methylobacterium planeticum TaxID=2615211 RepID=A0A6N6MJI4_9HYPH|nr:allophanate hydrolase subunit 1 [Methylobacterium planeticum]KAB1070228.1 allophanate hydrolase subunit 1 [Methylobacterium planeticum]